MFDVEQLTKATNLAKEMVNKGLAKDMEEAMEKVSSISKYKENNIILEKTKKDKETSESPSDSSLNEYERLKRRIDSIEYFLNDHVKKVNDFIENIKIQIEKLQNKVNSLMKEENNITIKEEKQEEQEERKQESVTKDSSPVKIQKREEVDPSIYDIKKIFDNSNNKLMKRVNENKLS